MVREEDVEPWLARGFVIGRREDEYLVPTIPPSPHPFLHLDDVDLDRLRELDEELRQDVPGTEGWRWTPEAFREETYSSPSVYLVAPGYAGICRVWLRGPTPRLGFVGVKRGHRGRGLGRALVAAALGETHALGHRDVTTEIDETNAASQALFRRFGARRIGGFVELRRGGGDAPPRPPLP
jgi:ribosomal protein S18 acetylase RimI-like enzyme